MEKVRSTSVAMLPAHKGVITMERPSELSIGPPQVSQTTELSPGKKKKAFVDVETDKLWAQVMNEDYVKFQQETEQDKKKAYQRKQEL
jgi:hypothetical protein